MTFVGLLALVATTGCGYIADKDRIKIAKFNDRYITRGELAKSIREMPDDERPIVRNKGDLLRALNDYIDGLIKLPLGEEMELQMEAQGKKLVSREIAQQRYFQQHTDDSSAAMYFAQDPEAVGMTASQLEMEKQRIDLEIDRLLERLRGEAAVAYRAIEAFKKGDLTITQEEYQQEYNVRKEELKKLEWMRFWAFRFPAETPNSETAAANVRKRLDAGESFEKLVEEYAAKDPNLVLSSEIENNPGLAKFQGFWMNASGSQKGDIIGPVFLPEYQIMAGADAQGRRAVKNMPAAYLVLQVLDHRPETALTLDEAKPALAPSILVAKMMKKLREENGVEIYEKSLPDPALFTDRLNKPFGESM